MSTLKNTKNIHGLWLSALLLAGAAQAAPGDPPAAKPEAATATIAESPAKTEPVVEAPAAIESPATTEAPSAAEAPAKTEAPAAAEAPAAVETPAESSIEVSNQADSKAELEVATAPSDPRLRFSMRGGRRYPWDSGMDAVYAPPANARMDLQADVRIHDVWWVGLGYQVGVDQDRLYDTYDTELSLNVLRAHAMYRRPLGDFFAVTSRAGASVWFSDLKVGAYTDEQTLPGLFAGAGVEFLPINPRVIGGLDSFSVGLHLEVLYDQVLSSDVVMGGTALGNLDNSGFGWSLGVVASF